MIILLFTDVRSYEGSGEVGCSKEAGRATHSPALKTIGGVEAQR